MAGRAVGTARPPGDGTHGLGDALARLLAPPGPVDPYQDYATLRTLAPVLVPGSGPCIVSGYPECRQLLADPAFEVPDPAWYDANRPGWRDGAATWTLYQGMQSRNPPDHTRLRQVLGRCFTPRRMALLRERVAVRAEGFLDAIAECGAGGTPVDLMRDLAFPLPVAVIDDLLGIPERDREQIAGLAARVFAITDLVADDAKRCDADDAATVFRAYLNELIAHRRRKPGEDLTSALIAAQDAGQLSREELLSSLIFLHGAGYGTTAALIGSATLALLADPVLAGGLRGDQDLAPAIAEEALRHEAPTQLTPRVSRQATMAGGTELPAGRLVLLLLGAANRDPRVFTEPDRFDPARREDRALSFGGGLHYCLGAPLSRMESAVALPLLVRRFPALRLAGQPAWRRNLRMRQLRRLPVVVAE